MNWVNLMQPIFIKKQPLYDILQTAGDAIIVINQKHQIIIFNDKAEQIFKLNNKKLMGKNIDFFIDEIAMSDLLLIENGELQNLTATLNDDSRIEVEMSVGVTKRKNTCFFTLIFRAVT